MIKNRLFFKLIILLVAIFSLTAFAGSQEQMVLAILDLKAQSVSANTAEMVSDMMRTELFNTGVFRVLERKEMEEILKEQAFQQTGCTATECAVEIGKILNANKMLVGTIGKLGEKYIITARIVDVEKGEMEFGDTAEAMSESDLNLAVKEFAYKLARKIKSKSELSGTGAEYQTIRTKKLEVGEIYGDVVKVQGNEAIIDVGSELGIKPGCQFTILEPIEKEYVSKISGENLSKVVGYDKIGKININYCDSNSSKGIFKASKSAENIIGKKLKFNGMRISEIGVRMGGGVTHNPKYLLVNTKEVYFKTGAQDKGSNWEFGVGEENLKEEPYHRTQHYYSYTDIDSDGFVEWVYESVATNVKTDSKYVSFAWSYKPIPTAWWEPLTWIYFGLGANMAYIDYLKYEERNITIHNYLSGDPDGHIDETSSTKNDIRDFSSLVGYGYVLAGLYFPPVPSSPILVSAEGRAGIGTWGYSDLKVCAGLSCRW
jgi:TolB-like protein